MAAKMVSLKLTKDEAQQETVEAAEQEAPAYSWGTTFCLNEEDLAKLGMTGEIPPVGAVMYMTGRVEVCSTSRYENQAGADTSLSLQITDLALEAPRQTDAQKLYNKT